MHFKRNLFWQVSLGIVFVFIVCHSVKWFCNIYELFHVSIEYISTFVLFKSCLSCIFCMGKTSYRQPYNLFPTCAAVTAPNRRLSWQLGQNIYERSTRRHIICCGHTDGHIFHKRNDFKVCSSACQGSPGMSEKKSLCYDLPFHLPSTSISEFPFHSVT